MAVLILNRMTERTLPYKNILNEYKGKKIIFCIKSREPSFNKINYDYFESLEDFKNPEVIKKVLELSKQYNIKHIVSISEQDLVLASQLREKLGLEGQSYESALAFRDKVVMKTIASRAVNVPKHKRINSLQDIKLFIEEQGYPIVIKPVNGAGSYNTYVIKNNQEMFKILDNNFISGYEIEEFIQGDMYTIDGFFVEGKIVVNWMGKFINDCLSFNEGKQASNVQISKDYFLYERLQNFIVDLLNVMPMPKATSFHCELFHTTNDKLVLCEIASRTGGAGINELGEILLQENLNHLLIKAQCGLLKKDISLEIKESGHLAWVQIPSIEGTIETLPTLEEIPFEWVKVYKPKAVSGKKYNKAKSSDQKIAIAIVHGQSQEQTVERMEEITDWIVKKTNWKIEV